MIKSRIAPAHVIIDNSPNVRSVYAVKIAQFHQRSAEEFNLLLRHQSLAVATIICIDQAIDLPVVILNELLTLLLADLTHYVTRCLRLLNQDLFQGHAPILIKPEHYVDSLGSQLFVAMFGITLHDIQLRWLPVHLTTLKLQCVDTGFFQPVFSPLAQVTLHPIRSHRFVHAVH